MLGVQVAPQLRLLVLMVATLSVSSVVSLTRTRWFLSVFRYGAAWGKAVDRAKSNGHYVAGRTAGRDFALRSRYSGAVGGVDRASGQHLHQCSGSAVSDYFLECAGEAERVSFLSVEKISAGYGGHPILADVYLLQLEQGCMMGILGDERLRKKNHPARRQYAGILPASRMTCPAGAGGAGAAVCPPDGTTGWIYSPKKRHLHRHIGAGCGADGL